MKVTLIPIVMAAFGTITKGLLQELEDLEIREWFETIQITVLLLEYWEESRKLEETCCQTPEKNHRLALVWKTLKKVKYQ